MAHCKDANRNWVQIQNFPCLHVLQIRIIRTDIKKKRKRSCVMPTAEYVGDICRVDSQNIIKKYDSLKKLKFCSLFPTPFFLGHTPPPPGLHTTKITMKHSVFILFCHAAVKGSWQSGFFDHGTFAEIMQPWAQTVVVGRARYWKSVHFGV